MPIVVKLLKRQAPGDPERYEEKEAEEHCKHVGHPCLNSAPVALQRCWDGPMFLICSFLSSRRFAPRIRVALSALRSFGAPGSEYETEEDECYRRCDQGARILIQ